MKPQLAIRTNANHEIGIGHIHRTLAYADYISDFFEVTFYIDQTNEMVYDLVRKADYCVEILPFKSVVQDISRMLNRSQLIILDGYSFDTEYQKALKELGHKILIIDDLNAWQQLADVVINHAYTGSADDYQIGRETKLYTGFNYIILKEAFLKALFSGQRSNIQRVLICIGGTDPNGYTCKIAQYMLESTDKNITIITYSINTHYEALKQLEAANPERCKMLIGLNANELVTCFSSNDLAILQPSNIALEACAVGIGVALLQTADNQKFIKHNLLYSGCAVEFTVDTFHTIADISLDTVNKQIAAQSQLPFKKARKNHRGIIMDTFLYFRLAEPADVDFVYACNNDKLTRQNSYNPNAIEYSSHKNWYENKIQSPDSIFLIFTLLDTHTGMVRIDKVSSEHIISITIAPIFRGLGLAATMLRKASSFYFNKTNATEITAFIKTENMASYKAFLEAGFHLVETKLYNGSESYKMILKNERY